MSAHGTPDPVARRRGLGFASSADAVEQDGRGLVGRVLRDELAAEGALEDRAAERRRAAPRPFDRSAEGVDRRELFLDPSDDSSLLLERRHRSFRPFIGCSRRWKAHGHALVCDCDRGPR